MSAPSSAPCPEKMGKMECQLPAGHEGNHQSPPFTTTLRWGKGEIGRIFYDPIEEYAEDDRSDGIVRGPFKPSTRS